MKPSLLQRWIDEFHATTRQQWQLRIATVLTPIVAVLAAAPPSGGVWVLGLLLVVPLAAASAFRPDTATALLVVAIVIVHWLAVVDDVGSSWLAVAAIALLVYHSLVALTSTVPSGGDLPNATLLQWLARTVTTAAATFGVWLVVVLFDRRGAEGNGLLTALALAVVAAAAIMIRSRSLPDSGGGSAAASSRR